MQMRIELCGGIASGKTTLTAALAERFAGCTAVFEDFSANGFLHDFYEDPAYYAYETEISFLLQHMHQIKAAARQGLPFVCDFSIEQDYAYAMNNLGAQARMSFLAIYQETMRQIMPPELIIFLDCPPEILLARIAARGRQSESSIGLDYLNGTIYSLKSRLTDIEAGVIQVDSAQFDFRETRDISRLLDSSLGICRALFE